MNKKYDPIALEILKMARELVLNEYTDKRAQDHNKWLADFETVWKNTRVRLPYPDIPPYPTELEIVKRAQVLMDFIHDNYSNEIATATTSIDLVQSENAELTDIKLEESLTDVVEEAIQDVARPPNQFIETEEVLETETSKLKDKNPEGILPSFLRKLTS